MVTAKIHESIQLEGPTTLSAHRTIYLHAASAIDTHSTAFPIATYTEFSQLLRTAFQLFYTAFLHILLHTIDALPTRRGLPFIYRKRLPSLIFSFVDFRLI